MLSFVDVKQNTDEWDALRLGKVTASNFSLIMANQDKDFGEPAKRYALQIALEKITGKKSEHSFKNEHMERGAEQEPVAKLLYENQFFCQVTNGGFFHCETYGDSPDGLVDTDGVIEIKSVIAPTHYANICRKSFDPAYKWQLIGHLDCTGRDWVDFISYCSDFPEESQLFVSRIYKVSVSEEIIALNERREKFINLVNQIHQKILEV